MASEKSFSFKFDDCGHFDLVLVELWQSGFKRPLAVRSLAKEPAENYATRLVEVKQWLTKRAGISLNEVDL